MGDVNWSQVHGNTPDGTNTQQATQLYHASATQASQAEFEEPAGTSGSQPAEPESDPEAPAAWMSDLVQELVNTQESEKRKALKLSSVLPDLGCSDLCADQNRLELSVITPHQRD